MDDRVVRPFFDLYDNLLQIVDHHGEFVAPFFGDHCRAERAAIADSVCASSSALEACSSSA